MVGLAMGENSGQEEEKLKHEDEDGDQSKRLISLDRIYSATVPQNSIGDKPAIVYQRKRKRESESENKKGRIRRNSSSKKELTRLRSRVELGTGERKFRGNAGIERETPGNRRDSSYRSKKRKRGANGLSAGSTSKASAQLAKKWVELEIEGADPIAFIGLECKVFWPLDNYWYKGSISDYSEETKKHNVEYKDGEKETINFSEERMKFNISAAEMLQLNLKCGSTNLEKNLHNELIGLAMNFHDCQDLDPGDVVWAKITGHPTWPAVVVDESDLCEKKGLKPNRLHQSILVQFFGTHDFSRIKPKQAIPFLNGLLSSLDTKCKQANFYRSLDEAKLYLSTQQLPAIMLKLQKTIKYDKSKISSDCDDVDSSSNRSDVQEATDFVELTLENLRVTSLGRIVCDSDHFHTKQFIWPEGYTAFRKFKSTKDPSTVTSYKMEVLRNPKFKLRPLFRVESEDGFQIEGPSPSVCWREIYSQISKNQINGLSSGKEENQNPKSGSHMFGFSNSQVIQLIRGLPNAQLCTKYFENEDLSLGYRAVRVDWKDLDRCNVCDMDEEYEDNLFLQCDKCRMMVHARCYGELEPLDGVLWLCNFCRPGAPDSPPRCCLCPITGGAMKQTTDGRWAHLACAIWIPETCLMDIKRMEPIDGISRINKDRWKLLCSICTVPYGACIQCSHHNCCVAYHPLCARAAGLCVELEDEDKIHLMSYEDEEEQCIRLLSYCKKHRQPSKERHLSPSENSNRNPNSSINPPGASSGANPSIPPPNPSGCARCEPYDFLRRRGQKQPEVLAAASAKRLYVENRPYLVTGSRQNGESGRIPCIESMHGSSDVPVQQDSLTNNISSMAEKYMHMKATFRKRLAFGKSRIHGYGVFPKVPHKAGDMVIEYIGEVVRPVIADIRERRIYNSLVGAGTYMFRIDDERVIDATRSGSIAHLINHSCEPNCYSRMISVRGAEHIIIFAKRDINQWEELTYDYRFFSAGEQLSCSCGSQRCRGVVNDTEAREQATKIKIPRSELLNLIGENRPEN
ncbi:histone-lysine N-methyltransferase ATX1-like protein [Carex littledalei]|uniref:Histone-lysine N-methyltransferase ATX1-like protein n=1 Tax=Carex littledalei TaxID=544730 RepID=A0A833VH47_9POAL|nr:histone-lysine N-methyltransferase ATX1-like protein [Carex littledalei]